MLAGDRVEEYTRRSLSQEIRVHRSVTLVGIACLLAASLVAQAPCAPRRAGSGYLALTGVTLWSGTGAPARTGMTVLIRGERIAAVFADGAEPLPDSTEVHSWRGKYVIPGLIDTHVHLATDPSGEDVRARAERRLCRALLGGVTTVRDMAGDVRALASLERDALVGDIAAPDIYYAALWAGPSFFSDPRTALASRGIPSGSAPWMLSVDSTTDLRQAVLEARGTGATALKLYWALTPDQVAAITAEAHRQHVPVWAHAAMEDVLPLQTVNAGVDVVSHAGLLLRQLGAPGYAALAKDSTGPARGRFNTPQFDSLMAAMRLHGTIYEPTLFVYHAETPKLYRFTAEITRRAHQLGVPIVAGTDSIGSGDEGPWQLPDLQEELELLVRDAGLSPADALVAATRTAAQAVSASDQLGTIEAGKLANLVVLDRDPLKDIANTAAVREVIKRGAVYPGGPVTLSPP